MKTCDEMVNSLLRRREQFLSEQNRKRKTAAKITVAGGSGALAVIIGALVWNSGMLHEKKTIVPDDFSTVSDNSFSTGDEPSKGDPVKENPTPQAPDYSSVIWAEGRSEIGSISNMGVGDETTLMNGKRIYPSLSEAFEKYSDDSVFAIVTYRYIYGDENFVYNGKTLKQYRDEEMEIWDNKESLRLQLLIVGDSLKYGEALYQTGTPDGERWAEELYYRTVSEIGEELISEYIVDGEFLKDKLEQDIRDLDNERMSLRQSYEQGCTAYRKNMFETAAEQINAQGIYLETMYSLDGPYSLIIFATKDEFAALSFDGMQNWYFALAEKCLNGDGYFVSDIVDLCAS